MDSHLTLKQKDRIAKVIYKNYQRAQLDVIYLNQHYNYYPTIDLFRVKEASNVKKTESFYLNQLEKKGQLEEYIQVMNQVHSHLSKESFFFIENEYINFYDTNWWIHLFSKATYYRIKHQALDELFESLHYFWDKEDILKLLR